MKSETITELQRWYRARCDGNWEHSYGIKIDTLDNPGWSVKIDIAGTELTERQFVEVNQDRKATDWIACKVRDQVFLGYGSPEMLDEIITNFLKWAQ
jgi:hypothetical protein